jgi:hypothetical protein
MLITEYILQVSQDVLDRSQVVGESSAVQTERIGQPRQTGTQGCISVNMGSKYFAYSAIRLYEAPTMTAPIIIPPSHWTTPPYESSGSATSEMNASENRTTSEPSTAI